MMWMDSAPKEERDSKNILKIRLFRIVEPDNYLKF